MISSCRLCRGFGRPSLRHSRHDPLSPRSAIVASQRPGLHFSPHPVLCRSRMMATSKPRALIAVTYEAAAQDYLRGLSPEHFMEATAQGRQREITLESLALVTARRPDVHLFNELLVQYPLPGQRKPGQVVPDNM